MKSLNGNESDIHNQSRDLGIYKQQLADYYQILLTAFRKIDKNKDDNLDQSELIEFLDSNMSNCRKFDRNIFKKIFEILDKDNDGKVSIDEFIGTYIEKQEELKIHQEGLRTTIENEKDKMQKYKKLTLENQQEILNANNISQNAKLGLEILNLHLLSSTLQKSIKLITVKCRLGSNSQNTFPRSANDLNNINQKFEFKNLNDINNDMLILEILNNDNLMGKTTIPLSTFKNQQENEIELEIHDENNERNVLWTLKIKIILITSYYKLYQDNYNNAEKEFNNSLSMLEKINIALENLTDPFRFLQQIDVKNNFPPNSSQQLMLNNNNQATDNAQYNAADKIESVLKNTLSKFYYLIVFRHFRDTMVNNN